MNDYEAQRLANIAANNKLLLELGIEQPLLPKPAPVAKKRVKIEDHQPRRASTRTAALERKNLREEDQEDSTSDELHFSSTEESSDDEVFEDEEEAPRKRKHIKRAPMDARAKTLASRKQSSHKPDCKVFGHQPDVEVGSIFETRAGASDAGIHAPWVAGISGDVHNGCWSIALSGGYADDVDLGSTFTYTGCGGRDLKGTKQNPKNLRTAPQSKDQELSGRNLSLVRSFETGKPVRVLRGFKGAAPWAPETGYRYDGLYQVVKWWTQPGLDGGFLVYKYAFKRLDGQPPLQKSEAS